MIRFCNCLYMRLASLALLVGPNMDLVRAAEETALKFETKVQAVSFSPNGKRLAIALGSPGARGEVKVFDLEAGKEIVTFGGHTRPALCVSWSPDGRLVASVGDFADPTVRVWDANSGKEVLALRGHTGYVRGVDWSRDGTRIASAGGYKDQTLRIWDAKTGKEILRLMDDGFWGVAWSPDGRQVATVSSKDGATKCETGDMNVWEADSGKKVYSAIGRTGALVSVSWGSDGKQLAGASETGTVTIWDAKNGKEIASFQGNVGWVHIAFSPDGKQLAGACGRAVKVWDPASGKTLNTFHGEREFGEVTFSPVGKRLAATIGREVRIWKVQE